MERLFVDEEDDKFGNFRLLEVNMPDGSIRQMEVSEKWLYFQKLKKEMASDPTKWLQVNYIGPKGERVEFLELEVDIDMKVVNQYRNPATGQLYGMYTYNLGNEELSLLSKEFYDELKIHLTNIKPFIKSEVRRAIDGD